MDFELPCSLVEVRDEAYSVARSVAKIAAQADSLSTPHPVIIESLRSSRLTELMVPAAFGGRYDIVDPLAVCVAREALMGTSTQLDSLFALQGIGSYAIATAGDPVQQEYWLPKVASLEAVAALGLTEEGAGSDLKSVSTTVEQTNEGLLVRGEKTWISNAGLANFYAVLAREGDDFSMLLVPADSEGLTTSPTPDIIAPHVLGSVRFNDVMVPTDHRLGDPGGGMELVLATLATFRVSVAGAAIGLASAALDEAVMHAQQRKQFGRPIIRQGQVAAMLADSWAELEASRLLAYRAAQRARANPVASLPDSSMAKMFATESAGRIVDRCVQIMGRWGLIRDSRIERLYRSARPLRIYEGASEVLQLGVAKALTEHVHARIAAREGAT